MTSKYVTQPSQIITVAPTPSPTPAPPVTTSRPSATEPRTTSAAMYPFAKHTFTNCGATGRSGPTIDQCRTEYSIKAGLSWPMQYLTMSTQGVQNWVVPEDGLYKVTAAGAHGGTHKNSYGSYILQGGMGRVISHSQMFLKRGTVLKLVVGQKGLGKDDGIDNGQYQTGGGGGTFVYDATISQNAALLVAGGGGGATRLSDNNTIAGMNASSSVNGTNGGSGHVAGGLGGRGGSGGKGGAGWATTHPAGLPGTNLAGGNGGSDSNFCGGGGGMGIGESGATFLGGQGGPTLIAAGVTGGFGGGGGSGNQPWTGAGGGGGYSGGGGGSGRATQSYHGGNAGGGGGSYSIDGNHVDYGATNEGHGYITIDLLRAETPTPVPTPAPTTRAPTPAPTLAPTSAAPLTPAPTPAPMPPPAYLRYPPNFCLLVHEGEWMSTGALKVLTIRGSTPSLQNFVYKDLTQIFAIDANGSVRTVAGQGEFLGHATNCDGVVGGSTPSKWKFAPRSLPRSYSLEVECADVRLGTKRVEYNALVNPWALYLGTSTGAQGGWFIVPVARTDG